MPVKQKDAANESCGCASSRAPRRENEPGWKSEPILRNLIPIAVATASGCEPCAEAAVTKALKQGSLPRHIEETLRIVAYMRTLDCLIQGAGPEVVARMEKPLAAAARALQRSLESCDE